MVCLAIFWYVKVEPKHFLSINPYLIELGCLQHTFSLYFNYILARKSVYIFAVWDLSQFIDPNRLNRSPSAQMFLSSLMDAWEQISDQRAEAVRLALKRPVNQKQVTETRGAAESNIRAVCSSSSCLSASTCLLTEFAKRLREALGYQCLSPLFSRKCIETT